jgi:hypothetical protein
MIVVAVVVTIYTAGAAAGLMAQAGTLAATASAGTLGASVLAGTAVATMGMTTGTMLAAAAIGGAVGSIASQGVGMAMGSQDKFSWTQVGLSAMGSAVTSGLGSTGLGGTTAAGRAATSSVASQGIGVATGLQDRFSWKAVAASAVGAEAGAAVGEAVNGTALGSALGGANGFGTQMVRGMAGTAVAQLVGSGRVDPASVFASTLGNALGESIMGGMQSNEQADATWERHVANLDSVAGRSDSGATWDESVQWAAGVQGGSADPASWRTEDGTFETQSTGRQFDPGSLTRSPDLDAGFGFPRPEGGAVETFTAPNGAVLYKISQDGRAEYFEPSTYGLSTDGSYNDAESRRLGNYPAPETAVAEAPIMRVEVSGKSMSQFEMARFDAGQAVRSNLQPYLRYSGSDPFLAETIGAQSLPGTVEAGISIAEQFGIAAQAWRWNTATTVTGSRTTGPIRGGTQPIIVVNNAAPMGVPRVMTVPAAPLPQSPAVSIQVKGSVVSAVRIAPWLSLGGTAIEYYLYTQAGGTAAVDARKSTLSGFAIDASFDLAKALGAGAAGAATGAAVGSFVPVFGNAVGAIVGFGVGIYAAVKIEDGYEAVGARNYWKDVADGK